MPTYEQIAIVGVGLLGGSIGLAVKARDLAERVVGIGRDQAKLDAFAGSGIVDRATTDLGSGVAHADLVVVCTPVELVAKYATDVLSLAPPNCLVTDVGSTKLSIVEQMTANSDRFVGSHPLAGGHQSGAKFARADLFEDKITIVTPAEATPDAVTQRVCGFWQALGAQVVQLTPEGHDTAVALTSHLPHAVAAALAAATPETVLELTAAGWADTTRVAAGDAGLWRQILLSNREPVLAAIDRFSQQFAELRKAVASGDADRLEQLLAEGKQTRDAVGN